MEEEQPGVFGPGGAYGQVFALFNCSMAAATMFGPIVAGAISEQYGWKAMTVAMGIFSISGAIPTVSLPSFSILRGYCISLGACNNDLMVLIRRVVLFHWRKENSRSRKLGGALVTGETD